MTRPASSVFITGTDTGVGKTRVASALVLAGRRAGLRALGMKPVASGAELRCGHWVNEDVEQLIAAAGVALDPERVNPFRFAPAIAPHLAAAQAGVEIELAPILAAHAALAAEADWLVVEGVGGWAVPLSPSLMQADLVRALGLPVILVVGIRLGAINHALLSAAAIQADGLNLVGFIANRIEPDLPAADRVLTSIADRIRVPLLADLGHGQDPAAMAERLGSVVEHCHPALRSAPPAESPLLPVV
ncbi:MAG: dethiobiotin synthase [Lysobacterales bacterium]